MINVITKLVERFREIDSRCMRDLPVYNSALEVEAVDFQQIDMPDGNTAWIGVLITPWFMNVIMLSGENLASVQLGRRVSYPLVSGEHEFMVGEDDELGRYDFMTLASPVLQYKNQAAARVAARAGLKKLLEPVEETKATTGQQNIQFVAGPRIASMAEMDRRKFLRGEFRKA